jgi:hypothetical protein
MVDGRLYKYIEILNTVTKKTVNSQLPKLASYDINAVIRETVTEILTATALISL